MQSTTSQAASSADERDKKMPAADGFLRACGVAIATDPSSRLALEDRVIRGKELAQALNLACRFPARHAPRLMYPRFGRQYDPEPYDTSGEDSSPE